MHKTIKKCVKILKLTYLWFNRILFAKNHFKVPFFTKLKANIFGGYLADQYILYDLKYTDKHDYLSEFDWYKSRYINEPFNKMLDNKIICTEILKHYVKVPQIYIAQSKYKLIHYNERVKTYDDIIALVIQEKQLFIKPISAGKGKGVYMLHSENGKLYIDSEPYSKEKFILFLKNKNNENWIITEAIQQNDFLNELYDKTTNTLRMITLKDVKTGEFKLFFAVQRIGTSKTIPVDNGSRGGLVCNIDLETGTLSEARSLHSLEVHQIHPDSKNPIKAMVIPNWSELKSQIIELANHLPFLDFIAWDVILVPDGICIIEANASSGVNIIQLWGGQRNGELGDFYRHHKVI